MSKNKAYAEAVQLLRRSNAAGKHGDSRLARRRTRGAELRWQKQDQK